MEEKTEQPAEAPAETPPQKNAVMAIVGLLLKPAVLVGLVAALAVGGMWAWKIAAVSAVEARIASVKTQAAQQAQAEIDKAVKNGQLALQSAQREKLLLFAKPLAWTLRDLVVADNQAQINDYIADLMKQPGFDRVVLARIDGSIALASDSKMVDSPLSKIYPTVTIKTSSPQVLDNGSGKLILVVPVMRQTEKMALLVLTYDPAAKPAGMP